MNSPGRWSVVPYTSSAVENCCRNEHQALERIREGKGCVCVILTTDKLNMLYLMSLCIFRHTKREAISFCDA